MCYSSVSPHSSSLLLERSHSGLVHRSRKPEWGKLHRGFKSHPLRQSNFGFRNSDCGFESDGKVEVRAPDELAPIRNSKSAIRNSRWRGARVVELAALEML